MENMMQDVARGLSLLISLYMMVIFIRVLLTWFSGARYGRAYEMLAAITDPYLDFFRKNVTLRFGALDFSPLVGILLLGIVSNIFGQIALAGSITVGYVLAIVLSSLWSVVSFFLTFFIILGIIQLVGILFRLDNGGRIWHITEQLVNPLLQRVVRPFLRGRFTSYRDSLFIFLATLVVIAVAGRFLANALINGALQLPF